MNDNHQSHQQPDAHSIKQTAASHLEAGGNIHIGSIEQVANFYRGIVPDSRQRGFVSLILVLAMAAVWIIGWVRLVQEADLIAQCLLFPGAILLSLICVYWGWYWQPEFRDQNFPQLNSSTKSEYAQYRKAQSRKQKRQLARLSAIIIPIITITGFSVWQVLPANRVLILVAEFQNQTLINQDDKAITINIATSLENAVKEAESQRPHIEIQRISAIQDEETAQAVGKQRKAFAVIWGWYSTAEENGQIRIKFEILNPAARSSINLFTLSREKLTGEIQSIAASELKSGFTFQSRLSEKLTYVTFFTIGLVQRSLGNWDEAIAYFTDALNQVQNPEHRLEQGLIYHFRGEINTLKGNYEQAILDHTQSIHLCPCNTAAYNSRGILYLQERQFEKAVDDFTDAITGWKYTLSISPDNNVARENLTFAYNNRGLAYAKLRQFDQASTDFETAIEHNEKYAQAYVNLGLVYASQGNLEQAITEYDKAIKLSDDFAEAYANRGAAYADLGAFEQAIKDLTQAIEYQPDLAELYLIRASVYSGKTAFATALADLQQALDLSPDYAEAYNLRGKINLARLAFDQSIEDFSQAIELQPNFAEAYISRGDAYFGRTANAEKDELDEQAEVGKPADHIAGSANTGYRQALADYKKAAELQPSFAETYNRQGLVYAQQNDYDRAISSFTEAIQTQASYAEAYTNRGLMYVKQEDYDKAIVDLVQATQLTKDFGYAYYWLGNAYYSQQRYEQAIVSYTKSIQYSNDLADTIPYVLFYPHRPDPAESYYWRGNAYYYQAAYHQAIEDYTRAIQRYPGFSRAYYSRGHAYLQQENYADATQDFQRVLDLDNDPPLQQDAEKQLQRLQERQQDEHENI